VIFTPTPLAGAFLVEPQRHPDERGHFARTFCADEFRAQGLCAEFPQCSTSFNRLAGTLRGMHWQAEPHAESKLVRATQGAVHDVIVDLRRESNTFRQWFGAELSAQNGRALYVPAGFAHGFITLADHAEVFYMISPAFQPDAARGARWDDPAFGIRWPAAPKVISARDRGYPDFQG
jgi:dTDP-4-dehydrorhamnose 3,5-epimerase